MSTILEVSNLSVAFETERGLFPAVSKLNFLLKRGESLGIVGESGSGKSVLALTIMGLLDANSKVSGTVQFDGVDLFSRNIEERRKIRGDKIAMIFQEPFTSLNPISRCGDQIIEMLRAHRPSMTKSELNNRTLELFELVGIPDPKRRVREYPHQLSGGLRQRVMIAIALSLDPDILIADEPTTALDVTIQAQILELFKKLKKELNMAIIFITHDLGVVKEVCDNVMVMYASKMMEKGSMRTILKNPVHPYTKALLETMPNNQSRDGERSHLKAIPGMIPMLGEVKSGCLFFDRCSYRIDRCKGEIEMIKYGNSDHLVGCINLDR